MPCQQTFPHARGIKSGFIHLADLRGLLSPPL
jgi:hypothetical protein